MAAMNISMSLTLADAASGPLKAFADLLAQLKAASAGVGKNLEGIAAGIASVSAAAAAAQTVGGLSANLSALAGSMAKVKEASSGVAAAVGNIGNRASAAGVGAYSLEQAMGALGGTLGRIVEKLTATAAGLGMVGAEARAAGAGVAAGTAQMQGGLAGANTHATGLMTTMKGLAQLYAAMKIEKGLVASVDEASKFEQTEARLKALNRPEAETKAQIDNAKKTSADLRFVSINDALEARLAAITGTAHTDVAFIDKTINEALKVAIIAKLRGDKSELKDIVRNLYGLAEMRGMTDRPEAMVQSFDFAQRAGAAAGGKLTIKDMETVSRQVKYGGGALLDEEGWSQVFAFANQLKASGHGGGGGGQGVSQAGTAITQLLKWAQVGPKNKETVRLMDAMGLMDASKVSEDKNDTTMVNVREGAMTNSQMAIRQPLQWANQVLGPAMLKYVKDHLPEYFGNKDPNDPHAQEEALGKMAIQLTAGQGGVNVGNAIALSVLPGPAKRLADEATLTRNAKKTPDALADLEKTYELQVIKFDATLNNLKITIGSKLLPLLTPLIDGFAKFVGWLVKAGEVFPASATMLVYAAAIGAVVLAISGFKNLFGIVGTLSAALLGMGTAGTVAAAGVATATAAAGVATAAAATSQVGHFAAMATGIGAALASVGKFFLRALPWVGLLVVAWDMAGLIANVDIGFGKIGDRVTQLTDWAVNKFRSAWNAIGGIVNSIRPGTMSEKSGAEWGTTSNANRPANTHGDMNTGGWAEMDKPPRTVKPQGGSAKTGGSGKTRVSKYDEELDALKNTYRLAEDADKRFEDGQKRQYAASLISAGSYFDEKLARLKASVANEIEILEKEKAAFVRLGDKKGAERVTSDITIKKRDLASGEENIAIERAQAMAKLERDAIQLQAELMKTTGQKHAGELIRLQAEMAARIKVLVLNQKITQEEGDAMLVRSKAAIDYQEKYAGIATLQKAYADRIAAINDQERNGTLSTSAAEAQKLALMKEETAQLDLLIVKLRELATASNNSKALVELDKLDTKSRTTQGLLPPEQIEALKAVQNGFANLFKGIFSGSESAGSAIRKFGKSLNDTFLNIISKKLGDALFDSLFGGTAKGGINLGGLFGGGGGGGGGLFGGGGGLNLAGLMGSVTGSGWYAQMMAPTTLAGTSLSFADAFAAGIIPLASGTDRVPQDMMALIHKDEIVVPAYDADRMRGGDQKPISVTNNFHIPESVSPSTQSQIAAQASIGLGRAMRRNN